MRRCFWVLIVCFSLPALAQRPVQKNQSTTQNQVDVPDKQSQSSASVDSAVDTDVLAAVPKVAIQLDSAWLQRQADALLDVLRDYTDDEGIKNELSKEKNKFGTDQKKIISYRIWMLKAIAEQTTKKSSGDTQ